MSNVARDSPRSAGLLVVVVLAGAVFVALAAVFWAGSNTHGAEGAEPLWAEVFGELGSHRVLPAATLLFCLVLAVAGRRADAILVLAAVTGAGVLTYGAKAILQVVGADDDGGRISDYPSGHSTTTAAFTGALVVLVWRSTENAVARATAVAGAAVLTALMSLARVESGGHTALDVLGGVALGVGWLAVCLLVLRPAPRSAPA